MDIRKLQKIKGGSFTLSIPKKWVDQRNLEIGEQMAISEEDDGSLSIYPVKSLPERDLTVCLALEEFLDLKALEYNISTLYIQGARQIDIVSNTIISAEKKRRLKLLRLMLPGVEVSEEGANKLSFQVLIEPAGFPLESLLRKTSAFSLHLQEDAVKSLVDWDLPLAREVIERSSEALRHYRLTIRQIALASLNKKIAKAVEVRGCQECVTFALMARDLSRLIYHCSQIAQHVLSLEQKKQISRKTLDLVEELSKPTYEMQRDAVQSFLLRDTKLAVQVLQRMSKVREREQKLLKEVMERVKDTDVAVTFALIGRDLRRMAGYSVAIADDGMNRALTPKNMQMCKCARNQF